MISPVQQLLAPYRLPRNPEAACAYLRDQLSRLDPILRLYKLYFPHAWRESTAEIAAAPGMMWSPRQVEFFGLLSRRIPIFLRELIAEGDPSWGVPLALSAHPVWEQHLADLRPGWPMLLVLLGEAALDEVSLADPAIQALLAEAGEWVVDADQLLVQVRQLPAPLPDFEAALDIMYDEQNPFLRGWENPIPTVWSRRDLDWLLSSYAAVERLQARAAGFLTWLEADSSHVEEVCRLWIQCAIQRRP